MAKAFVETTVLTDALLKSGEVAANARAALRRYSMTELPVYAIKEFKAGPLKNFVWFHNKLVVTHSFGKAVDALQRMSLTPRRYTTATALEALRDAALKMGSITVHALEQQYGPGTRVDQILCDRFRLSIRMAVIRAWQRRRSLVSVVVHPLPCYLESDITEDAGQLVIDPVSCVPGEACAIAQEFKAQAGVLRKLKDAVDSADKKPENERRSRALRHLIRTPKREFPEEMCRALGDSVFVLLAPKASTILTTNIRDIEPLAKALGKTVDKP